MAKKIVALCQVLILFASLIPVAFAHPSQVAHDNDLSIFLFGERYYLTGEKKAKFQAIADAAALCIDQFSSNEGQESKKQLFDSLDQRIGFSFSFEDVELQKLPGGINASAKNHRRYTHRGWNFKDYPTEMQQLWERRKLIITATVNKELFGKDPGILKRFKWVEGLIYSEEACNDQCDAFCELVYYVHILGDYEEASSYSSEFQQLIPLVRNPEDITAPAMIDELLKLIPILFESQPWSTPILIQELQRIKADAERIILVQGGIRTEEQFNAYHDCAIDLIDTLQNYIPGMLKNIDFFSAAFY